MILIEQNYFHKHLFINRLNPRVSSKKKDNYWKIIRIKIISLLFLLSLYYFLFTSYYKTLEISSKNESIFMVCRFGTNILKSNHRILRYFYVLNKCVPKSKVVLAVSEYTIIEPNFNQFQNLIINIEKYGNETFEDIQRKYGHRNFYFNALRYSFYYYYLQNHPETKYVVVSDEDTLFIRDPLLLIDENPNIVHIMEDIFPFSNIIDSNYIWTNAWVNLNDSTKKRCGLKFLNKSLLSTEIKDLIPLNCGTMLGSSKNLIKIFKLMSLKFKCAGMFLNNAEQGLLMVLSFLVLIYCL